MDGEASELIVLLSETHRPCLGNVFGVGRAVSAAENDEWAGAEGLIWWVADEPQKKDRDKRRVGLFRACF